MGITQHFVKRCLRKYRDASGGGIIGVWPGQVSGTGTQGTVSQHFQGANSVHGRTDTSSASLPNKFFQFFQAVKIALLVHPDGQFSGGGQFLISGIDGLPGDIGKGAVIVALTTGDAVAVEGLAGGTDHGFQIFLGGNRDGIIDHGHGIVKENAIGLSLFHDNLAALRLGGMCGDPQKIQNNAVHRHGMTAGPHRHHRPCIGHLIQIPAGGHPANISKIVLIPAPANDPAAGGNRMGFQTGQHLLQAVRMGIEGRNPQNMAIIQQVHMAVVESGTDKVPRQIHPLIPFVRPTECFLTATCKYKAVTLHHKGLCQRKGSCIDISSIKNCFHGYPPLYDSIKDNVP